LTLKAGELFGFLDDYHQNQQQTGPTSGAEVLVHFQFVSRYLSTS